VNLFEQNAEAVYENWNNDVYTDLMRRASFEWYELSVFDLERGAFPSVLAEERVKPFENGAASNLEFKVSNILDTYNADSVYSKTGMETKTFYFSEDSEVTFNKDATLYGKQVKAGEPAKIKTNIDLFLDPKGDFVQIPYPEAEEMLKSGQKLEGYTHLGFLRRSLYTRDLYEEGDMRPVLSLAADEAEGARPAETPNAPLEDDALPAELPYDLLEQATDPASALKAVTDAVTRLTDNEKADPVNIDHLVLFAEAASSNAAAANAGEAAVVLDRALLAPISAASADVAAQADKILSDNGAPPARAVRSEALVSLSSPDAAAITIAVSAADVEVDKIRVKTPFADVTLPIEFVRAAVADGADFVLELGKVGALAFDGLDGSMVAVAAQGSGAGVSVKASKPIGETYGISVAAPAEGSAIFDESGKIYPSKLNPARKTLEYFVDGKKAQAVYGAKAISKSFTDISQLSASAQSAINALASNGIINGMTETTFEPGQPVTRGQIAQLLMSALTRLDPDADGRFADVGPNDWARPAAGSAKAMGVIAGYDDGTFRPGNTITKDQIVAVAARTLWKTMKYKDVADEAQFVGGFKDSADIPGWARADVAKAAKANLFPKLSNGKFEPSSDMARGDTAVIIKRLFDKLWL
jgi:hypothetical protein